MKDLRSRFLVIAVVVGLAVPRRKGERTAVGPFRFGVAAELRDATLEGGAALLRRGCERRDAADLGVAPRGYDHGLAVAGGHDRAGGDDTCGSIRVAKNSAVASLLCLNASSLLLLTALAIRSQL